MTNGKQTSFIRSILVLAGALVVLIAAVGLCLPFFFSTSMGKDMLVHFLQNRFHIGLSIDSLSLSWFGGQKIQGLRAIQSAEQLELTAVQIQTDSPLWHLMMRNNLGNLHIASPEMKISKPFPVANTRLQREMQRASFCAAPQPQLALPAIRMPLIGHVIIDDGKIALTPSGLAPILFDQVSMTLDLSPSEEMALNLVAKTSEQNVQGEIAIKGSASQLQSAEPEIAIQATLTQLPVRGIDQILSLFWRRSAGLMMSMMGPTLNVQSQLNLTKGNFDLNFNATSNNLNAQIVAQSQSGTLSLKSPASINYTLTPEAAKILAALLPTLPQITLSKPAPLQCLLSQFTLPFPGAVEDIAQAAFDLTLNGPGEMPLVVNATPFAINGLLLRAVSAGTSSGVTLNAKGTLQSQAKNAPFAIDGTFNAQNPEGSTGSMSFNWLQMPTDLLAQLSSSPQMTQLLGAQLDCSGTVNFIPGAPQFHLTIQSPLLSLPSMDFTLSNQLALTSPCAFTYQVGKDVLKNKGIQLDKDYALQGTLQNLITPVQDISLTRCDAQLSGGAFNVSGGVSLSVTQLQATLSINSFDSIALQINADPFKTTFQGGYKSPTDELMIKQPLFLQFSVDDALLKKWTPSAPSLAKPFLVQCSLNPMVINLGTATLQKLKASGSVTIPELALSLPKQTVQIAHVQMPFQWDPLAKSAALEFSAAVPNPSAQSGSLQGQISLSGFNMDPDVQMKKALMGASCDFQNISSSLLDVIAGKALSAIVGPTFSGKLKVQSAPDKQTLALNWNSPYLNWNTAFSINSKAIELQGTKNQLNWTLTPEGYQVLDSLLTGPTKGVVPFEVQEKSTFAIQFDKLYLPVTPKQTQDSLADRIPHVNFDLGNLEVIASARNPALSFFDKSSHESIQLSTVAFTLNKSQKTEPMAFSIDTSVVSRAAQGGGSKSGTLSLAGKILPSYNAQEQFDMSKLTTTATMKMQQFPSRVLDILARAKGRTDFPFSTLFGEAINADASLDLKQFSGPVNLSLNSRNTRLSLAGTLAAGALTLRDHVYAQLKITPEISRLVLREFNPLSLSYLYSQDPVSVEILSDGFYMPIYPLQVEKTTIPEISIELGKIVCKNEGNVNVTLGLLKSKKIGKNNDLDLWFAPMDLHIKQGSVDMERTEVLIANTFDVALWGNVNIPKDRVDMVLGLTANTLKQAFGVKNLPDNYVLTLPMRGTMDNVKIDTGKATAKVALLLAWQQAESAGAMAGGSAGALIGGLVGKMATLPDSDAKVPPAKHPFPWEVGGKRNKKATSHKTSEKKKHFKQNEKPLKQILKVIR